MRNLNKHTVIPAKAGTQNYKNWIPACAGTTDRAFTLVEMLVVVGIIALLMVFGIPAVQTMVRSFHSDGEARAMISSALACARAIAAKEQTYAGIRFQKAYNPNSPNNPLDWAQYMIFIIYDPCLPNGAVGSLGCRAMEGMEPIKLPAGTGVTDLMLGAPDPDRKVANDGDLANNSDILDVTTFSVLFSPTGRLIIHELWVVNRDQGTNPTTSRDDIFNTQTNVQNGIGMFFQDEQIPGIQRELSRNSFIIYDENILKKLPNTDRYSKYLQDLAARSMVYVNPHTGTLIEND